MKSLDSVELKAAGVQMILANAYHLHLRPGDSLIQKIGGLHSFMNWPYPILTDSGGYQVFSLSRINRITEEGVEFQNHLDGSKIFLTPELSMEIQMNLSADILMAFDHCPQGSISREGALVSMERTFEWLKRSKQAFSKLKEQRKESDSFLFGIVQGGMYEDLRQKSLEQVESLDLPGVAVGGMSVGESKEDRCRILKFLSKKLPKNKPRYLMGVGTPEDIIFAVDCGFDLFDCVLPTRTARTGRFWTFRGFINIRNEKYKMDHDPVDSSCLCLCCSNYSRSYLRHLFLSRELLAYRLATLHNIYFYMDLMKKIRRALEDKNWSNFRDQTLKEMQEK